MTPTFIGLDLSRKATGICILEPDRIVALKTVSLDYREGEMNGHLFQRLFDIVAYGTVDHGRPAVVATEVPFLRGFAVSRVQFGLAAAAQMACAECGWRYMECFPTTLKKYATGSGKLSGKAGKIRMMDAAMTDIQRKLNRNPVSMTEHEADAYWLARWAQEHQHDER